MRKIEAVARISPCDNDFTDPKLQTIEDAKRIGPVICSNIKVCRALSYRENISCTRLVAQEIAIYVSDRIINNETREQAMDSEVQIYLDKGPGGKYWTLRNGKWEVAMTKRRAMGDIVAFANTIIGE